MNILLGFGPTRLCRRIMSRCRGTFLYNHYPLEPREAYESLCEEFDWKLFDSGGDLGLHKSFTNWFAATEPEGYVTILDPDSDPVGDWQGEIRRIMAMDRMGFLSLMTPAAAKRKDGTLENGVLFLPTPEHMHTLTVSCDMIRQCGFDEPNRFYGGLESMMDPIYKEAGWKVGWASTPDLFYDTPMHLVDPQYALWKRVHNNGYGGSFAEYLAGLRRVFCPVCTAATIRGDLSCATCLSTFGVDETMPCTIENAAIGPQSTRVPAIYLAVLSPIGWRAMLWECARSLTPGGVLQVGCFSGISRVYLDAEAAKYGLRREGNIFTRVEEGVL